LPETLLCHPETGITFFGSIEATKVGNIIVPSGHIILKRGVPNAFGVAHIWARHKQDMNALGYSSIEQVPHYVAEIVHPGAVIQYESDKRYKNHRLTIVKSERGIAILEFIDNAYSIVTAYNRKRPRGSIIGSVRPYEF